MPTLTRAHYNLIADATNDIITLVKDMLPSNAEQAATFAGIASRKMTEAMAGTNSQFKADRFRERCLGIRAGR